MDLPQAIRRPPAELAFVVPLSSLRGADRDLVGAKAANLSELIGAGFTTPDGVVVTTAAYRASVGALAASEDPARIEAAAMLPAVASAIRRALGELADVPVAVRSSALAEDLVGSSFAGQYDTVLGARGPEEVLAAVRHCWASNFSERARHYRAERGIAPTAMAVVIQRLVDADAAGVALTANPVTGRRDETLVSAVKGLGERLVSGMASPDEFIVRQGEVDVIATPEKAIDVGRARDVAELALRAQQHFGAPQDIEWAIADGRLFILQSRPMTALPVEPIPLPVEPPEEGFWEQDAGHNQQPLSPLFRGIMPRVAAHTTRMFERFGFLLEGMEFREIGGTLYQRFIPLGGKDRKPPPDWMMPIIMPVLRRLVPSMRRRIARCVEAYRNDEFFAAVEYWNGPGREAAIARNERLRAVDLEALDDRALIEHLRESFACLDTALREHVDVVVPAAIVLGEFVLFGAEVLDWDQRDVIELLTGTSVVSTAPGQRTCALAGMARSRPAVLALLKARKPGFETALAGLDPEFAAAFARHQYDFGCRGLRGDIMFSTVGEQPELLAQLIVGQVRAGVDAEERDRRARARQAERLADARAALAERPEDRAEFERLLHRALVAYPVREDNAFLTHGVAEAILRYASLEVGKRLAARGAIDTRDDVFYLEEDEVYAAFAEPRNRRAVVQRRKGEYAWALTADMPPTFGPPQPPDPPTGWMPREMQRVMKGLMWLFESANQTDKSNTKQSAEGGIVGLGASPGVYEGTVRIVVGEEEFSKIEPGDVLVCKSTQPVWSVLFSSLGAVVADAGGIASHQAIVSREYGIPCVVATGNATELLSDGQRVRVDGRRGLVELL